MKPAVCGLRAELRGAHYMHSGSHFASTRILSNMRLSLVLSILFFAGTALGHPPVSVVVDSKGNLYYSDLEQVFRVTPDGRRSVAVPHVHSHELFLDAQDNLYGEHTWYEGERVNKWGHYVWKRHADGRVSRVIAAREGFLTNYSFVRDRSGTMYWSDRDHSQIRMRKPGGKITIVAGGLKDMRWMHATSDGTLYVVSAGDLVRVKDGQAIILARNLAGKNPGPHALMGIWSDRAGNVYVADHSHGDVKRVTRAGEVTTFVHSPSGWSPCGGVFAPDGSLWLLESTVTNAVRLRKAGAPRSPQR